MLSSNGRKNYNWLLGDDVEIQLHPKQTKNDRNDVTILQNIRVWYIAYIILPSAYIVVKLNPVLHSLSNG